MGIGQCFIMALKSLSTGKMRAFLTMLGIIIGVAAVIIIMSMGNGLTLYINDAFSGLGTTSITVSLTGRGSTRTIDVEDLEEFFDDNRDLYKAMTPNLQGSTSVRIDPSYDTDVYFGSYKGVNETYCSDIQEYKLSGGRGLCYTDIVNCSKVCVVGAYFDYLYNGEALGQYLKLNGEKYQIIGVVEPQSEDEEDIEDETGVDQFIVLPYTTAAKKLSRNATISSYTFVAADENRMDEAMEALEDRLYETFLNEDLYSVSSFTEIVDTMNEMIGMLVGVLSGIAAISLLVGGIGIMNIMLVSVTERTREIGIRKALGAKGRHIRLQFVIEAGTTSAIGGIIGILVGMGAASLVSSFIDDFTAIPTLFSVLLSFGISVGIGVLFGYLPANKAAKLNPIDALHYD